MRTNNLAAYFIKKSSDGMLRPLTRAEAIDPIRSGTGYFLDSDFYLPEDKLPAPDMGADMFNAALAGEGLPEATTPAVDPEDARRIDEMLDKHLAWQKPAPASRLARLQATLSSNLSNPVALGGAAGGAVLGGGLGYLAGGKEKPRLRKLLAALGAVGGGAAGYFAPQAYKGLAGLIRK